MGPDWLHRERQDEGKGSVARNAGYGHGVGAQHGRASTLAGPCLEEEEQGLRARPGLGLRAAGRGMGWFYSDTLRTV